MDQSLNVQLIIPIPDEYVLITKVEYNEMKQNELTGVYWTMQDLEQRIGKKEVWIKNNILLQPQFFKQLDVQNGGFVYYPKRSGERWSFQATKMAQFLEDNFYAIFKRSHARKE